MNSLNLTEEEKEPKVVVFIAKEVNWQSRGKA